MVTVVQSPAKHVGSRKNSFIVPKKLITKKKIVAVAATPTEPVVKKLAIEDFDQLGIIGRGSFGLVMLVRNIKSGDLFALK